MRITGKTRIVFILADPVDHIIGTDILNKRFAEEGHDIAVSPLHVAPKDLAAVIGAIRALRNVIGFGVTIPHKIDALNLVDKRTTRAAQIGSVNFVKRDADGTLTGDNVDGKGFIDGLQRNHIALSNKRILQIGAGGAGRAVAFAMADAGASELCIHNRTLSKGADLAAAVQGAYPRCSTYVGEADPHGFDLVVNTTSVGMHEGDAIPVDTARLSNHTVVAEIIMKPEMTSLLIKAKQLGCKIVLGKAMMEEQFKLVKELLSIGDTA
jgi:shikimate dehydrogenase